MSKGNAGEVGVGRHHTPYLSGIVKSQVERCRYDDALEHYIIIVRGRRELKATSADRDEEQGHI